MNTPLSDKAFADNIICQTRPLSSWVQSVLSLLKRRTKQDIILGFRLDLTNSTNVPPWAKLELAMHPRIEARAYELALDENFATAVVCWCMKATIKLWSEETLARAVTSLAGFQAYLETLYSFSKELACEPRPSSPAVQSEPSSDPGLSGTQVADESAAPDTDLVLHTVSRTDEVAGNLATDLPGAGPSVPESSIPGDIPEVQQASVQSSPSRPLRRRGR